MYPEAEPIQAKEPIRITSIEQDGDQIRLVADKMPDELREALAKRQEHYDIDKRIHQHAVSCAFRIRDYLTDEQRQKFDTELPESLCADAPGEARDALLAMHKLSVISQTLQDLQDIHVAMKRALCLAIDAGQLRQAVRAWRQWRAINLPQGLL